MAKASCTQTAAVAETVSRSAEGEAVNKMNQKVACDCASPTGDRVIATSKWNNSCRFRFSREGYCDEGFYLYFYSSIDRCSPVHHISQHTM